MFDPTTVDAVAVTPERDAVLLYLFERDGWSGSDEQLLSLQEKIHTYVGFAVDGQLSRDYPETAARSIGVGAPISRQRRFRVAWHASGDR
jgi:Family of unknown function (DUF6572)